MLLDKHLPDPDFAERHSRVVAAGADAVAAAVERVTPAELPFLSKVLVARRLPADLTGQRMPDLDFERPLLEQLTEIGFTRLGSRPDERAWGIVGTLWQVTPDFAGGIETAPQFDAFDDRGWAKAAWNLAWAPVADGDETDLRSETRVVVTDRIHRLRFRAYWYAVKPAGGRIRKELLAAVAARAEREDDAA